MANIQFKVTGYGDFSSLSKELKSIQAQVDLLNKSIAGTAMSSSLKSQLYDIQNVFKSTLLSSGQFVANQVKLTSETEKFGQALTSGKLKLGEYFNIITKRSSDATKSVASLAEQQVKLNNSIVQQDITKSGVYTVYTPTNIDKISKATEIATAKQNIYNLAVKHGSEQLVNFGKNTQWAGRQLTVGLSMPILLFGSQAIKTFQDVNTELVRMQKVYGTGLTQPTTEALNTIKKQVTGLAQELAKTMGVAAKDTAAMAADLAATGKTGNDLLVATREAIRLSKLGEIDTQAAMKATVSLQNVYKLSTQELSGAVNFLNAVENQTSTSLQDLVDGIPRVGPIVQQLGGSFKDTAVMMVAMKEAGVPAAQSANAIKSAIASLINPTKAAKDAFAAYNVNLASIATTTKGNPVQMIMMLQQSLKGLAPLVQAQLIEKLFGKFQEARIQALITNLGAVNSQTRTAFDLVNASAPQLAALAASEMKIATESTTGKFKRAIETIKADLLPLGQKIMEVATTLMNFGNSIANFFSKLPGPIKSGLGILLSLGVISGPIIMVTGLLANLVGQGMKVGYALWGMIDGTKKWKDLMTPASIAAKTATDVFNSGLLENIASLDAMNAALQRVLGSLTAIGQGMSTSAGGVLGTVESAVLQAEAGLAGGRVPFRAPGMASGGIVPGSGNSDTYPAMLTPGESVIPKDQTKKFGPFINAMIQGRLPGYAKGLNGISSERIESTSDAARLSGMGGFGGSAGRGSLLQSSSWASKQLEIAAAREALLAAGYSESDIQHQLRLTGAHITAPAIANTPTFGLPYKTKSHNLEDVMPEFEGSNVFAAQLSSRGGQDSLIMSKYKDAVKNGTVDIKDLGMTQQELIIELDKMKENVVADTKQHARIIKSITDYGMASGTITEKQRKQAIVTSSTLGARLGTGYYDSSLPTLGNLIPGSAEWEKKQAQLDRAASRGWAQHAAIIDAKHLMQNPSLATSENISRFRSDTAGKIRITGGDLAKIVAQGEIIGSALDGGTRKALDEHSNSKKGHKTAREYLGGMHDAIREGKPLLEEEAVNLGNAIDDAASGKGTGIQSRFSRAFGAKSILMSGSPVARMGLSMGASTASQMLAPLINKLPGGNIVTDAMTAGSMGMTFGPWGAAAGAAIGLVSGGINKLIQIEKQHAAEAKADFAISAEAVSMMGGTLADTSHQMMQFTQLITNTSNDINAKLAPGILYTNAQFSSFTKGIESLPKDNALSLVMNQLKGISETDAAKKVAEEFVQTQMAINGISKDQADVFLQMMLAMSGHNAAGAGVSAANQLEAIKSMLQSMKPDTKQFTDFVGNISNIAVNTNSWEQYKSIIDAIGTSAENSTNFVNGLVRSLQAQGDWKGATNVSSLQGQGYSARQIQDFIKAQSLGIGIDTTSSGTPGYIGVSPDTSSTSASKTTLSIEAQIKKAQDAAAKSSGSAVAAAAKATAAQQLSAKALAAELKPLEAKKKVIDSTIKSLEQQLNAQKRLSSFETSQADLKNQQKLAQAQGDYLKAAMLGQQVISNAADYNGQTQLDKLKAESDALGQTIADKQQKNADSVAAQQAAINANTGALGANTTATDKNTKGPIPMIVSTGTSSNPVPQYGGPGATSSAIYSQFPQLKPAPGEAGVNPARWNTPSLGISGLSSRAAIKKYAELMHFEDGTYFSIDENGYSYKFLKKKGGNIEMISKTKNAVGNAVDALFFDPKSIKGDISGGPNAQMGPAKKKALGGLLFGPGSGTSDSIRGMLNYSNGGMPINLSNGEYIQRAAAVQKYGVNFMDAVNSGRYNPEAGSISNNTFNVTINAGANANADDIAKAVIRTINQQQGVLAAKNNKVNTVRH